MSKEPLYCESLFAYHRNPTRKVNVGVKVIGGDEKIQIQSMTTTDTTDTESTAKQVMSIVDAGADIVRITTQGRSEAHNLVPIKKIIRDKGYNEPLVADIHFNPNAAMIAAANVEKVRINPGNFAGGAKKFDLIDYTDQEYAEELNIVKSKLKPFLQICKENNTAVRIGTNHGSLSDRIMSRYGDTPQGMVESCMEYLRICREFDFNDIVLSIKASNTRVMVHTVRLLVVAMKKENMDYPLHLGVTEAGSEDEGRIKSAVGSGALLVDGLGDTIRVSLTEDPEKEVPVANKLVNYITARKEHEPLTEMSDDSYSPYEYKRRKTHEVLNIGNNNLPVVIQDADQDGELVSDQKADYMVVGDLKKINGTEQKNLLPFKTWLVADKKDNIYPILSPDEITGIIEMPQPCFLSVSYSQLSDEIINILKNNRDIVILLKSDHTNIPVEQRAFILKLNTYKVSNPVVLHNYYNENEAEDLQIKSAADAGILFLDGLADGLYLTNTGKLSYKEIANTVFGILQASRVRFTKTEFISCPGCGRTLFDLQETTRQVKKRTSHLKGLKIGIMGCIVNGVGEMADADYGYVGSGPDKVSLFRNRGLIKKNLSGEVAIEELIKLIKEHGDWIDP